MLSLRIYVYQNKATFNLRLKVKEYLPQQNHQAQQFECVRVYDFSSVKKQQKALTRLRETFDQTLAKIKPTVANCDKIDEVCNPFVEFATADKPLRDLLILAQYKEAHEAAEAPSSLVNLRQTTMLYPIYIHKVMRYKRAMTYLINGFTPEEAKSNADVSLWLSQNILSHTKPTKATPIRSKVIYTIYFDRRDKQLELIKRINETQLWDSARNVAYNKSSIEVIKKLTEEIKGHPEPEMDVENLIN